MKHLSAVTSYYNENAEQYAQSVNDVDMTEVLNKFLKYTKNGDTVMDIGCGTGRDLRFMASKQRNAIGLDISLTLCKQAEVYSDCVVRHGSVLDLDLEEELDGATCIMSLLHLENDEIEIALSNIKKALKNKGSLYIALKEGSGTTIDELNRPTNLVSVDFMKACFKNNNLKLEEFWFTSLTVKNRKIRNRIINFIVTKTHGKELD